MELTKRQAFAAVAGIVVVACVAVPWFTWRGAGDANGSDRAPGLANAGPDPGSGGDVRALHTGVGSAGSAPTGGSGAPAGAGGTGSDAAAAGGAEKKPVRVPGLGLRVSIVDTDAQAGEPVRARVQIENSGTTPISLCDPLLDFPRRVEILYRYRNVNYCAMFPPGPMQSLDSTKLIEIPPGHAVEVVCSKHPPGSRMRLSMPSTTCDMKPG